jgi:hypothetical protein
LFSYSLIALRRATLCLSVKDCCLLETMSSLLHLPRILHNAYPVTCKSGKP